MDIPALILCEAGAGTARIAGLSVPDRLVVSLHRAGCASITIVCGDDFLTLKRAKELKIPIKFARTVPALSGPALIASADVLANQNDIARVLQHHGRLVTNEFDTLPIGVVEEFDGELESALADVPQIVADHPAAVIRDVMSARKAAKELWHSLSSTADGIVDRYFNRPLSRIFSKALVRTAVTPNQVSILSTIIGMIAASLFCAGTYDAALIGALLLQFSAVIDCVDGDLARILYKESRLGKWLDIVGDQIVHISVFAAIGVGLFRSGANVPALALSISAVVGVVLSFAVVARGMMSPSVNRTHALQKLIDATTNRDFSVVLIVLALVGHLEVFLWAAGLGVHVFWIVALLVMYAAPSQTAASQKSA